VRRNEAKKNAVNQTRTGKRSSGVSEKSAGNPPGASRIKSRRRTNSRGKKTISSGCCLSAAGGGHARSKSDAESRFSQNEKVRATVKSPALDESERDQVQNGTERARSYASERRREPGKFSKTHCEKNLMKKDFAAD